MEIKNIKGTNLPEAQDLMTNEPCKYINEHISSSLSKADYSFESYGGKNRKTKFKIVQLKVKT